MTTTAQQLARKAQVAAAAFAALERAQRSYDTMIGRATGRLQKGEVHTYVHERPAFCALIRARGWA